MENNTTGTIFLPTSSGVALYGAELRGQFSDGMWENCRPFDHWKFWSRLNVQLSQNPTGTVATDASWLCKKNDYSLYALLPVIGDRMLKIGRMGKVTDSPSTWAAAEYMPTMCSERYSFVAFKALQVAEDLPGYVRDTLHGVTDDEARAYYRVEYTMKDLKADLTLIKETMRTVQRH